jgi:predicted phage tail component-like protein
MFELYVENFNGEKIRLSQNESKYQIVNIEGLNPPKAAINTTTTATISGVRFKSSKLEAREIVITVKINGEVEKNRLNLYQYFGAGAYCKIYYSNDSRNVYCEGHVETIECGLFTNNQEMQISIICENPYLVALNKILIDISKTFSKFIFPFAIDKEGIEFSSFDAHRQAEVVNPGEIETGMIITLRAKAKVVNPIIYNAITIEFIKLNTTLNEGDTVIINTNRGRKSITKISDGVISNVMNTFDPSSTWLSLKVGNNIFTYSAEENEELLDADFEFEVLYEGV